MKRATCAALLAALVALGCGGSGGPSISRFGADRTTVSAGDAVTLSWVTSNASQLSIDQGVGTVTGSSVVVNPLSTTTYTLTAQSGASKATATAAITVNPRGSGAIVWFVATPPQAAPGDKVTLSWALDVPVSSVSIQGLAAIPAGTTSVVVTPSSTTAYTLTVQPQDGTPQVSSTVVARVAPKPSITGFSVPATAKQGDTVVLSWDAAPATSYTLSSDKGFYRYVGNGKSAAVQANESATWTLNATGPTGSAAASAAMVVTPVPATQLAYAAPLVSSEVVQLVADPCAASCTSLPLRLVTTQPVTADAVALDLPLQGKGKVALHATSLTLPAQPAINPGTTPPAAAIALPATGPLANVLTLGLASKPAGNGATAGGQSIPAGTTLAGFSLDLVAAGGAGTVFSPAAAPRFELRSLGAVVAKNPGALAVGTLTAQP